MSNTAQGAYILFTLQITIGWDILSSGGQAVQEKLHVFLLEDGTDRLSRNVGKGLPLTTVWKLQAGDYEMVRSSVHTNIPK